MLDPDQRTLFVDALRPPPGMTLAQGVGTTFTLDLDALMIVPVALAAFDVSERADGDPILLLETVRRYADRIDLFCQAGMIGVPRAYQAILTYLEESIHPVTLRRTGRIFHPKVWVLLFEDPAGDGSHLRVLVASRNLTFDRSWDLLLRLDEDPRRPPVPGLAEFIEALPRLARGTITRERAAGVRRLADVARTTGLAPPHPFTALRAFRGFGLGAASDAEPITSGASRVLVLAPYVSDGGLRRLRADARSAVLVSRQESLDALTDDPGTRFDEVLVFDSLEEPETITDTESADVMPAPGSRLHGLHAKLYVAERGATTTVLVGSGNATDAAFAGNVEVLVELAGRTRQVGLDRLLGTDEHGLRLMLVPYVRSSPDDEPPKDEAQRGLVAAAMRLAGLTYTAEVIGDPSGDTFGLRLRSQRTLDLPAGITARCWPLSIPATTALEATGDAPLDLDFGLVSLAAVTSFFGVELSTTAQGEPVAITAVITANLVGVPEDRRERVLTSLLRDRSDVMRYLLLLLLFARERDGDEVAGIWEAITGTSGDTRGDGGIDLPLFESMVRALASHPESLDRVARLIDDLRATEEGRRLLPDDLDAVWDPIWQARQELR